MESIKINGARQEKSIDSYKKTMHKLLKTNEAIW